MNVSDNWSCRGHRNHEHADKDDDDDGGGCGGGGDEDDHHADDDDDNCYQGIINSQSARSPLSTLHVALAAFVASNVCSHAAKKRSV